MVISFSIEGFFAVYALRSTNRLVNDIVRHPAKNQRIVVMHIMNWIHAYAGFGSATTGGAVTWAKGRGEWVSGFTGMANTTRSHSLFNISISRTEVEISTARHTD
jgi:hypothetical protein